MSCKLVKPKCKVRKVASRFGRFGRQIAYFGRFWKVNHDQKTGEVWEGLGLF